MERSSRAQNDGRKRGTHTHDDYELSLMTLFSVDTYSSTSFAPVS